MLVPLGLAVCFEVFYDILTVKGFYAYLIVDATCLAVCCVILITFTILKRFKKPLPDAQKTAFAFLIPQVLLTLSATSTLIRKLLIFESEYYSEIHIILRNISEYLYICEPIVLFFMLRRSSKDFKKAQCCRTNIRNYTDYDIESNPSCETAENRVAFHRNSDYVLL